MQAKNVSTSGKPLAGRRIAVTRARDQASELAEKLAALGAGVVELPLIRISRQIDPEVEAEVFAELGTYDWIVFTSPNGVRYFFEEFHRVFDDIRSLGFMRVAVVGEGTAKAVTAQHIRVECQPKVATGEALAEALVETGGMDNAKLLVITGNLNRDTLIKKLEEARAIVDRLQVYKTEKTDLSSEPAAVDFRTKGADALLFASSSAVQSFVDQAGALKLESGAKRPLAGSIGPLTSETMRSVGMPVDFEAKTPSLEALVEALVGKLAR